MAFSDNLSDLEHLIADAMGNALEGARRALSEQIRKRSESGLRDARERGIRDLREATARLDGARTQADVLSALLEEGGRFASRTALFLTFADGARRLGRLRLRRRHAGARGPPPLLRRGRARQARRRTGRGEPLVRGEHRARPTPRRRVARRRRAGAAGPPRSHRRGALRRPASRLRRLRPRRPAAPRLHRRAGARGAGRARAGEHAHPGVRGSAIRRGRRGRSLAALGSRRHGGRRRILPRHCRDPAARARAAASSGGRHRARRGVGDGPDGDDDQAGDVVARRPTAGARAGAGRSPTGSLGRGSGGAGVGRLRAGARAHRAARPCLAALLADGGSPCRRGARRRGAAGGGLGLHRSGLRGAAGVRSRGDLRGRHGDGRRADRRHGRGGGSRRARRGARRSRPWLALTAGTARGRHRVTRVHHLAALRGSALPVRGDGAHQPGSVAGLAGDRTAAPADVSEDRTVRLRPAAPVPAPPPPAPAVPAPDLGHPAPAPRAPTVFGGGGSTEVQAPPDLEGPGWAFRTGDASTASYRQQTEENTGLHEEARRLARLLVSEIKLYNEEQVEEGRASATSIRACRRTSTAPGRCTRSASTRACATRSTTSSRR